MNKGKPSGKYAKSKTSPGRKGSRKRSGWPEDARTQNVADARWKQPGSPLEPGGFAPGFGSGRDKKAGSPV
jgi:hypothetical protein